MAGTASAVWWWGSSPSPGSAGVRQRWPTQLSSAGGRVIVAMLATTLPLLLVLFRIRGSCFLAGIFSSRSVALGEMERDLLGSLADGDVALRKMARPRLVVWCFFCASS